MYPEERSAWREKSVYTRRQSKQTEKTQKKDDPVLRCTMARCWAAAAVLAFCLVLTKANPDAAARVSAVYHTLLEAPMGQTAVVWSQTTREVGLSVLLDQVEQSIMVYAQKEGIPSAQGGELNWDEQGGTLPGGVTLARPVFSAPASAPANGFLSCVFGPRIHPITGEDDFHTGIDIAAAGGSGVYAAWPGVVQEVGSSAIYGNYITVDHGGGVITSYCHCRDILAQEGSHLRAGERIATVGSTGISTGNHLHFEIQLNDRSADPLAAFDL
jgi:murein DD-endopeptidase MepM/ murein hydrolase activator NlpD